MLTILAWAIYYIRVVNDIEELPFPMAAVGASGITALTNTHDPQQAWRWRCFSIGGMLGMALRSDLYRCAVDYGGFPA